MDFGRYRLEGLIGAGAMGEVYRAFDHATRRVVAVKVLPAHLIHDPTFEARFRQEAEVAAGLNDPHVVPIHNFGEINGRLYVDMRLIDGFDLEKLIQRGPMPPERAVSLIEQVGSALETAHRAGLVHRDVKPSNILVAQRDFAYLIDFGIARVAGHSGFTTAGQTIGTLAYMAPERFEGAATDPRSDVYGLTCVLYECLTGRKPFAGDRIEQVVHAHLMAPPPRPSQMMQGVPPAFDDVIAWGMAKDPNRRFQTASDLVSAARAALASSGRQAATLPTPPVGRGYPPIDTVATVAHTRSPARQSMWRRNWVPVTSAAVVVVTVACVASLIVVDRQNAPDFTSVDVESLLVRTSDIRTIMGDQTMVTVSRWKGIGDQDVTITPSDCADIVGVMDGSLLTDRMLDVFGEEADAIGAVTDTATTSVTQSVYQLADSDDATEVLEANAETWRGCLDTEVTFTSINLEEFYQFVDFDQQSESISVVLYPTGSSEFQLNCRRTMAATVNVIADVRVCTKEVGDQSTEIAQRILDKVTV